MAIYKEFGPYRILRQIGKGGMGDVFLAVDSRLPSSDPNRQVALKILWMAEGPDAVAVLEAERQGAQLQARLYSIDSRVARVNGYGELEDSFYIDMEYIEGRDLAELIKAGPVPPGEATRIGIEIADILLRAHTMRFEHEKHDSRGVVHGDIKPRNIRIDSQNRVRLLDFGIAKALSMTRKLTRNEFGSVGYSSPERLDTGEVNEQSDLWALAVVIYELVCGSPAFGGDNTRKIEQIILSRTPPRPFPPHVPESLRQVLKKALAPRPEERFLSAVHVKKALQAASRQMVMTASPQPRQDSDATRRTLRPDPGEPDATRRTVGGRESLEPDATRRSTPADLAVPIGQERPDGSWSHAPAHSSEPSALATGAASDAGAAWLRAAGVGLVRHRRGVVIGTVVAAMVVGAGLIGFGEMQSNLAIPELAAKVNGRALPCEAAWREYLTLTGSSLFRRSIPELREPLTRLCEYEVDQVLKRYKTDDPRLFKSDWERASAASSHLMHLGYSPQYDAWKSYTQGHVERIGEKYPEAIASYQRAAERDTFCDPYLALMHLYAYNKKDLEEFLRSQEEATRRNCLPQKKKHDIWLAELRLWKADQRLKEKGVNDSPGDQVKLLCEVRQLSSDAHAVFKQYQSIGNSRKFLKQTEGKLKEVDRQLEQLGSGTWACANGDVSGLELMRRAVEQLEATHEQPNAPSDAAAPPPF